ncbi:hypothetical protein, partial [Rhizobium laguerreae]|uniref:hypothetical protein n=1 Tax=Rhizobium laguerreae TaxID=1076926 RepID=UPI001C9088A2
AVLPLTDNCRFSIFTESSLSTPTSTLIPKLDTLVFNDLHGCASSMALSRAFGTCALAMQDGWRKKTPAANWPKQFRIALSHLSDFRAGRL